MKLTPFSRYRYTVVLRRGKFTVGMYGKRLFNARYADFGGLSNPRVQDTPDSN